MQAGQAVQMGKIHGGRIRSQFSIRKEIFILKKAEDFLAWTPAADKIQK
jgi:hypothetical protein